MVCCSQPRNGNVILVVIFIILNRRLVTKEFRREITNLFGHREHVLYNKQWFGAVARGFSLLNARQDRYPPPHFRATPLTSVPIVSPSLCVTHTPTSAIRNRLVHFHLTRRRRCSAIAVRREELCKNASPRVLLETDGSVQPGSLPVVNRSVRYTSSA